jgi:uncharacterized protein HemX
VRDRTSLALPAAACLLLLLLLALAGGCWFFIKTQDTSIEQTSRGTAVLTSGSLLLCHLPTT